MALTNALSAIALVGSLIILGRTESTYAIVLGFVAVVASTINVVGGFLLTDRMLRMFRRKDPPKRPESEAAP
jgi:NAD(P) transhydrogenase subunit alpha